MVQCVPLESLLLARAVTRVHLLVLDVEGAERAVLSHLDLAKFDVQVSGRWDMGPDVSCLFLFKFYVFFIGSLFFSSSFFLSFFFSSSSSFFFVFSFFFVGNITFTSKEVVLQRSQCPQVAVFVCCRWCSWSGRSCGRWRN